MTVPRALFLFVPALLTLLGLGTWQLERRGWKAELIGRIEERAAAVPVPLPARIDDAEAWDFRRVTLGGTFRHDRAMPVIARPREGRAGYELVTPLERPDGAPVLVNRGFVPMDGLAAVTRPEGPVTLTGVVRVPRPAGLFQPDNRPGAATWMRVDVAAMVAAAGLTEALPVVVELPPSAGSPGGVVSRVDLPNDHLQYAITWYSLAGVLTVIFLLSQRRRPQ